MTDERIASLMKLDPLAYAEDLTGERVDSMNAAFGISIGLMHAKSSTMKKLLTERGDVWDGMPLSDYIAVLEHNGFEQIYSEPFSGRETQELHLIFGHRDGLLLSLDTYHGDRINGGKVYYAWQRDKTADDAWILSGGSYVADRVWVGDHDIRQALIFNLDRLRAAGTFLTPWPKRPFLWLLHYMDTKVDGYDYAAINRKRLAALPKWVQEMVGSDE